MSHVGTEDKFLKTLFPQNLENKIILDLGHGIGKTGLYIKGELIENGTPYLVGLDIYPPYNQLQQRLRIYDELHLLDATKGLPLGKVHISVAQQFIEHLSKTDALYVLSELERITMDRIIICTPNGFHISDEGTHGNQYSKHLSGWTPRELNGLGYKTKIVAKNVNSRALQLFAKTYFMLRGKTWENEMIVAWKDMGLTRRIVACGCGNP